MPQPECSEGGAEEQGSEPWRLRAPVQPVKECLEPSIFYEHSCRGKALGVGVDICIGNTGSPHPAPTSVGFCSAGLVEGCDGPSLWPWPFLAPTTSSLGQEESLPLVSIEHLTVFKHIHLVITTILDGKHGEHHHSHSTQEEARLRAVAAQCVALDRLLNFSGPPQPLRCKRRVDLQFSPSAVQALWPPTQLGRWSKCSFLLWNAKSLSPHFIQEENPTEAQSRSLFQGPTLGRIVVGNLCFEQASHVIQMHTSV